jgi:signal transduction histidine kinase/CheY-like chemotaxis protein
LRLLSTDGETSEDLLWTATGNGPGLSHNSWSDALFQEVLGQSQPLQLEDFARAYPLLSRPPGLALLGPFLGVPLLYQGHGRGALYFARFQGEPAFEARDGEVLLGLAASLDQRQPYEESRLLSQLRLLNHVAQAAAGSLDLPALLTVALRELHRFLPFHVCVIWLRGGSERESKHAGETHSGPTSEAAAVLRLADSHALLNDRAQKLGLKPGLCLELAATPFGNCLANGQAVYADLGQPEGRTSPLAQSLAASGADSLLAVPLRAGDRVIGILQSVCTRRSGFTNEQTQMVYLVADLLGPAISNCQLFARLRTAYDELRQTQSRLIHAEKMRALGELASGMAHDFNNSLCGVLGFLDLALAGASVGTPLHGYLESARTCSLDAAETVRRVQNFARWQRHELATKSLDLNQLVQQTVELTRHKWEAARHARGTGIQVELRLEAKHQVSGSAAELREVLTNLIFNAVDAMPHGGKLIVHTWSTAGDVHLSVRDTGVGMSESVRQRLFEPFFTTKGELGNGLGQSVTFGIIQRYGGEITAESSPGQGSTFLIRLPVLAAGNAESAKPASSKARLAEESDLPAVDPPDQPPTQKPRSLRVLVIDDEDSIRRFLAAGLTQLGHRPHTVSNATEGLAAFAEEPFDVILSDLGMPGISGEEVARTVARQSPGTPVILLTGWSHQLHDGGQVLEGVTRILGKPVLLNTLAATLTAVCPN